MSREYVPARGHGALDGIAFWGLLFLIIWAPLPLASNRPWSMSLLACLAALLLAFWLIAAIRDTDIIQVPLRRLVVPAALYLAVLGWALVQAASWTPASWHNPIWAETGAVLGYSVTSAISIDPVATVTGVLRMFAYGAVFLIAAQFGRRSRDARRIIWAVAIAGIIYSLYGLAVFTSGNKYVLWLDKWAYFGDLTSTFVARAAFGAYAGLCLLVCAAVAFEAMKETESRPRPRRDRTHPAILARRGISRHRHRSR